MPDQVASIVVHYDLREKIKFFLRKALLRLLLEGFGSLVRILCDLIFPHKHFCQRCTQLILDLLRIAR